MNGKYYDSKARRLAWFRTKADAEFWDKHWSVSNNLKQRITTSESFLPMNTACYLPVASKILEGGCGIGNNIYALKEAGYDAIGIDFAKKTVDAVNVCLPDLHIRHGDVRKLEFPADHFDGYWSLGVIEHFEHGYSEILKEMKRVLCKGGYLFLTVPGMSLLRRFKAMLRIYPPIESATDTGEEFYQYALSLQQLKRDFSDMDFTLLKSTRMDGLKGLKDELTWLRGPLQTIYDGKYRNLTLFRRVVDYLTRPFCGHLIYCVFRKD